MKLHEHFISAQFSAVPRRRAILREHSTAVAWIQRLSDVGIVLACFYVLAWLRNGSFSQRYQLFALVAGLLMLVMYEWLGTYRQLRMGGILQEAQVLFKAWTGVMLALALIGFISKSTGGFSREVLLKWAVVGYVAQVAFHWLLRATLRSLRAKGRNIRNAVLVGCGEPMQTFYRLLTSNPWLGIRVIGYLGCDLPEERGKGGATLPMPRLGSLEEAHDILSTFQADLAYIVLPIDQTSNVNDIVKSLIDLNIDLNWVPDLSSVQLINHGIREIGGQPIICLSDSPLQGMRRYAKWMEDKFIASLMLILASPLFLFAAIGVRLSSPGPVLFKQRRGGLDGKIIEVWKFRTMKVHEEPEGVVAQASANDPRITPLGAFLRRTSLDELPQLLNVLQGRMSMVGPRPHALEHNELYRNCIDSYMLRHRIKPGITGWAQVNGWRGETADMAKMETRVKFDLYYINNWSVWFDLKIIFMTIFSVLSGKNAI